MLEAALPESKIDYIKSTQAQYTKINSLSQQYQHDSRLSYLKWSIDNLLLRMKIDREELDSSQLNDRVNLDSIKEGLKEGFTKPSTFTGKGKLAYYGIFYSLLAYGGAEMYQALKQQASVAEKLLHGDFTGLLDILVCYLVLMALTATLGRYCLSGGGNCMPDPPQVFKFLDIGGTPTAEVKAIYDQCMLNLAEHKGYMEVHKGVEFSVS